MAVMLHNAHLTDPDYISGTSQDRIHILVSTPTISGVMVPIKALFSVLDNYNILKYTKYKLQVVRHMRKIQLMEAKYAYGEL